MISILSLVTSVKDYVEIVHKLIESDSSFKITNYDDLGPIITYMLITLKEFIYNVISLNWLKSIWDLPIIIPSISSAMISEISVLDGYFHNAFNFLDTPISYGETNVAVYSLEKFTIGLINSLFIFIPTGTAHLITLRRFVMQGLEAGYLAGLGSIFGSILWIASVIFGWRFFVIPWLSLDIFRYLLGFVLLVKYMWDSYNERKTVVTSAPAKQKIFLLNFLLALTEQTSIYPFISNISVGSESSIIESFPAQNYLEFISIHGCYIVGLTVGCLSLLHLTCWFWENPAFKIYMWMISSFKVSTSFYYKALNFTFLYLTMICAISSIPYYGLDYTLTNPLGFVQDDRILDQKSILETSFLNTKASDRNTRKNRGRRGRRERWKRRIRKYRTFDASLYDQGIYDLFTVEDLNYGFDRFWLRRKMRNHTVRFRFFPGPWMRSFKKQLAKPRLESYAGPRQEFFRILFEQVYHPSFHEYNNLNQNDTYSKNEKTKQLSLNQEEKLGWNSASNLALNNSISLQQNKKREANFLPKKESSMYFNTLEKAADSYSIKENLKVENSTLRKFVRKINNRIKSSEIKTNFKNINLIKSKNIEKANKATISTADSKKDLLYSKRWKQIFSKISHDGEQLKTKNGQLKGFLRNFYQTSLTEEKRKGKNESNIQPLNIKKQNSQINLSKKDQQILKYRSIYLNQKSKNQPSNTNNTFTLLHPLKFYLEKQQAFERKLRYYTPTIFRKFSIENNAPYFRVMMKRYFYYYKPTLRWERTMKVASLRKARRKTPAAPRKIQLTDNSLKNLSLPPSFAEKKKLYKEDNNLENTLINSLEKNKIQTSNPNFGLKSEQDETLTNSNIYNRMAQPTHNYTIIGKRASRYRYQIYKDVLQHWYYSPFNRLLLKFDVDLFIKRQPNSHFLTKNEENLLHLRRFLLSEHYNTLRWYTYMQHYRSMKTKIGGTKSFASGVYNQQFTGTFKKIRHLFAITPSQKNQTVLKFDQPLYNEYSNTSKNKDQRNLIIHEELLTDDNALATSSNPLGKDLLNQSTQVVRDYLRKTNPIKQEYIKKLIQQKNYVELTQFLYKGQKTRGLKPITNEKSFLAQEKEYLLSGVEQEELKNLDKLKLEKFLRPLQQDLWVNLLKKWKRKVNDQEFLRNYLQRRIDKREKRKQKKERNLKAKLKRLENLLPSSKSVSSLENNNKERAILNTEAFQNFNNASQSETSTGIQKALIEGVATLKHYNDIDRKTMKTNQRENFAKNLNWATNSEAKAPSTPKTKDLKDAFLLNKEMELQSSLNKLSKIVKEADLFIPSNIIKKDQLTLQPLNLKQISYRIQNIYSKYKQGCNKFLTIKLTNIFQAIVWRKKSMKNWQKKERSLNKQKRARKEFKVFSKKPFKTNPKNYLKYLDEKSDILLMENNSLNKASSPQRKKRDSSFFFEKEKDLTLKETNPASNMKKESSKTRIKDTFAKYFTKKFKRKKSPQRRARIRRNRGVTKKRTLSDSLKREFKNLRKYNLSSSLTEKLENKKQKIYLSFNSSINKELSPDGVFKQGTLQRRSKQKKQRFWKQKRSKYSQKLRKYRKRRRSVLGKVRILKKQLQRIKVTTDLKNWWWKNFLPNLRATTDSLWQYEKDRQIQQKLLELSIPEILERNELFNNDSKITNSLQIGDFDFKPLAMPEAIKLRENLLKENAFNSGTSLTSENNITSWEQKNSTYQTVLENTAFSGKDRDLSLPLSFSEKGKLYKEEKTEVENLIQKNKEKEETLTSKELSNDIVSRVVEASLIGNKKSSIWTKSEENQRMPTNPIPFYAGWDESLRKFVVTNRLLSRRDSGYEMRMQQGQQKDFNSLLTESSSQNLLSFTSAPLKGMNAATTLYWQIPFTTYDPDQFFALGMDGFAPLGWRRFQFRHSILKSWLYEKTTLSFGEKQDPKTSLRTKNNSFFVVKNKTNILENTSPNLSKNQILKLDAANATLNPQLIYKLKEKNNPINKAPFFQPNNNFSKLDNKTNRNIYRRLKKRYRRVKKHPRSPAWFPSGPLLNQVLPVHYIYIFYKRSRLPRDRYIKRRLRKSKTTATLLSQNPTLTQIPDLTLRKRVKTKRKYHIKKDFTKKSPIIPRRMKFLSEDSTQLRWRPLSRQKLNKPIAELIKEQRALKYKQRKKENQDANTKQPTNLRIKQLRRRVQRQIIRSVWRYKPRAGGFVWPGDYLKLELVKAPKLSIKNPNNIATKMDSPKDPNKLRSGPIKVKRKKKRSLQEWQIQPKKYLLQKHNYNVIKKKLEKAQRSNKIAERIKEFNLIL